MASSPDADPVVREIPVYLSTELASQLYLVQHPLFSTARSDDANVLGKPPHPSSARIRPNHGKLELGIPIPGASHFAKDHTEANNSEEEDQEETGFGYASDSASEDSRDMDVGLEEFEELGESFPHLNPFAKKKNRIAEHRLTSSVLAARTHYAMGAMRDGHLHITPVSRILQMRAGFEHVDKDDERRQRRKEQKKRWKEGKKEGIVDMETDKIKSEDHDKLVDSKSAKSKGTNKKSTTSSSLGSRSSSSSSSPPAGSSGGSGVGRGPAHSKSRHTAQTGYRKRESERAMAARLSSWAHQHQAEISEAFVDLTVHEPESDTANDAFQRLFYDSSSSSGNTTTLPTFPAPLSLTALFHAGVGGLDRLIQDVTSRAAGSGDAPSSSLDPNAMSYLQESHSSSSSSPSSSSTLIQCLPAHVAALPRHARRWLLLAAHAASQEYGPRIPSALVDDMASILVECGACSAATSDLGVLSPAAAAAAAVAEEEEEENAQQALSKEVETIDVTGVGHDSSGASKISASSVGLGIVKIEEGATSAESPEVQQQQQQQQQQQSQQQQLQLQQRRQQFMALHEAYKPNTVHPLRAVGEALLWFRRFRPEDVTPFSGPVECVYLSSKALEASSATAAASSISRREPLIKSASASLKGLRVTSSAPSAPGSSMVQGMWRSSSQAQEHLMVVDSSSSSSSSSNSGGDGSSDNSSSLSTSINGNSGDAALATAASLSLLRANKRNADCNSAYSLSSLGIFRPGMTGEEKSLTTSSGDGDGGQGESSSSAALAVREASTGNQQVLAILRKAIVVPFAVVSSILLQEPEPVIGHLELVQASAAKNLVKVEDANGHASTSGPALTKAVGTAKAKEAKVGKAGRSLNGKRGVESMDQDEDDDDDDQEEEDRDTSNVGSSDAGVLRQRIEVVTRERRRRAMEAREKALVLAIAQHAVIVRGNWVACSRLMYSGGGATRASAGGATVPQAGAPSGTAISSDDGEAYALQPVEELICSARDAILAILERDEWIFRKPLSQALKPFTETQVKELLSSVAELCRPKRAWCLKRPDDLDFLSTALGQLVARRQRDFFSRPAVVAYLAAYDAAIEAHPGGAAALRGKSQHIPPMVDAYPGFI